MTLKKKIKNFIKKHEKSLKIFALTNKQFFAFVLIMMVEVTVLGVTTLGSKVWSIQSLMFDISIIILLGAIGYLFRPKKQYIYLQTVLILTTLICLINGIYYTFYNSYVTVGLIESLGQVNTVTDAVFDKLTPWHLIYVVFPLMFHVVHLSLNSHNYFNYVSKIENGKKNFGTVLLVGVILLCMNIVTLTGTDISRLVKQWNREYIVERYGILVYQINDVIQSAQSRLFSYFGYDDAASKFLEYYSEKDTEHKKNKYTGIYKDKNLVFIHMESLMTMFIDLEVNGQEVTPNLNKLKKEGLYFSNFYPQVSVGTSSDTEFTLSTSLMPALSGTVFVNYYDRNYTSIQKLLKEKGYYTFSMHGNNSSMWNRAPMHKSLGYDKFYAKESFNVTEENSIGLGISDHDFFEQMIPYLKDIESKNDKYMGTLITLTNHTPWDGGDAYGEFELSTIVNRMNEETGKMEKVEEPYLKDTKIGNYIRSVHYADQALGEFINSLYENKLFDDTVIVFYGDHDAKLNTKEYNYLYNYDPVTGVLKEEGDEGYIEYDYYANELNRKTPLIIWSKDKKYKGEVNYYMGMIDVLPTLGNMFGFESKYALGHDIFDIKNKNVVVFPNGNFLTESLYYNNSRSEYRILNDSINLITLGDDYIEEMKKYTEEVLELSNSIIVYNLIELEGDKINSETT